MFTGNRLRYITGPPTTASKMRFLLPLFLALCVVPVADAQTIGRCQIRSGTQCVSANLRGAALPKANLTISDPVSYTHLTLPTTPYV